MFARPDFKTYKDAARSAAVATVLDTAQARRVNAEPYWVEAVHAIVVRKGCPCAKEGSACFLKLKPETRKLAFAETDLSYEKFLEVIEEALALVHAATPIEGA